LFPRNNPGRKAIPKEGMTSDYFGDLFNALVGEPPLPAVLILGAVLENALMTVLKEFLIKSDTRKG